MESESRKPLSERYGRHIRLAQIGEAGQRRLEAAQVLIVGLGGLGSPVAMYLAASGVGRLVLSDYDHVELSNLQRQIVHRSRDIGRNKVDSARDTLLALNPEIEVIALDRALDEDLDAQVEAADVVVDATDNFESRFALNAACWRQRTPLVSGAAIRMEGQIAVFDPADPKSPCYRCLYRDSGGAEGEPCALVGVLAPLLGIIGSVQATETLKLITGFGDTLAGRLIVLDAALMEWRELRLPKDPACPVCGPSPSSIASCASRAEP